MQPLKIVQRPTPPPRLPPVEESRLNSSRSGILTSQGTTVTKSSTAAVKKKKSGAAQTSREPQSQQQQAITSSALEEVSVEGCLEYLTRPHTSWSSAVKIQETLRERVEEQKLNILTRSMLASRRSSFMERCAANGKSASYGTRSENGEEFDSLSVCSAPAGFPRRAQNASRSCTGTLRKAKLVNPYTPNPTPNNPTGNTSSETSKPAVCGTSSSALKGTNGVMNASLTVSSSSLASMTSAALGSTTTSTTTTMRSSVASRMGQRGMRTGTTHHAMRATERVAEAELMIVGAAHQHRDKNNSINMPGLAPLPHAPLQTPAPPQGHQRPMLARPARVAPMLPPH